MIALEQARQHLEQLEYQVLAGRAELLIDSADASWQPDDRGYVSIQPADILCFIHEEELP